MTNHVISSHDYWIVDSGFTNHMDYDESILYDIQIAIGDALNLEASCMSNVFFILLLVNQLFKCITCT